MFLPAPKHGTWYAVFTRTGEQVTEWFAKRSSAQKRQRKDTFVKTSRGERI